MFSEETLFILGAGASANYGYPLGKELIEKIIDCIESESVYVKLQRYITRESELDQIDKIKFKLSDVIDDRYNLDHEVLGDSNEKVIQVHSPSGYYSCVSVHLRNIEEFSNLSEALQQFDPVSIDAFLNNHPSYALAGKIMIVYNLLKCEDPSAFHLKRKRKNRDGSMLIPDNWYSYLVGDLLSGCNKPEDIANNNINILTFNYDVSADYALKKKLSGIEMLKGNLIAENYINELINKRIKHIYGKLYEDDLVCSYGNYREEETKTLTGNTVRFNKAVESSHLIKLINEERTSEEIEIHKGMLSSAKKIIIIGFGFDRDNLTMLGFPAAFEKYKLFEGKQLQYMDYNGSMRGLSDQFKLISEALGVNVTRSVSKRITDAYQNDFKIRLY
tara:strand:- start:818 stop:1984 length:1167 start_codon:yes stop_codon:yes gene_type:complete